MSATCDSGTVAACPVRGSMFVLSTGMRATSSGDTRIESGYTTMTSCEYPFGSSHRVARWPGNSGCSVAPIASDAETGRPRLLAIDAHVELRNLAVVARLSAPPTPGTSAHGLQHLLGGELEPRRLPGPAR